MRVIVVGGGVFGWSAAWSLRLRGYETLVFEPGPVPRPEASSTDISKAVRLDYGANAAYTKLAEAARERWIEWNQKFQEDLYHEVGFLVLTRKPMSFGSFEYESYQLLTLRGHPLKRVKPDFLRTRFPALAEGVYVDGYLNPHAGWANASRVVELLCAAARKAGAGLRAESVESVLESGGRVSGVRTRAGAHFEADAVVVTAGAWTPRLVPQLGPYLSSVAQPVLYFRAADMARYRPPCLGVWAADIATTGWYGFPARSDGTFKVARHDLGYDMDPDAARVPLPQEEETFRAFLAETFPGLADAPLIAARLCMYCDTADGNFWIGADPQQRGLVVASGGSGHAFKFAPLVGDWVASAVEGNPDPATRPFAWRNPRPGQSDQARCPQRKGPGPGSLSAAIPLH